MKKLVIFVIVLLGCSEEPETKYICNPFRMTISDAIPVQFWINGLETFNQKEVCGITQACFCQQFNCDDEIRIQISDADYDEYELSIVDNGGIELQRLSFSGIASGVYQISFVLSELEICDEQIQFKIYGINTLANSSFTSNLNSWVDFGSGNGWTWDSHGGEGSATSDVYLNNTTYLRQAITVLNGSTIEIEINYDVIDAGGDAGLGPDEQIIRFSVFSGSTPTDTNIQQTTFSAGSYTLTGEYNATSDYDYIGLRGLEGPAPTDARFYINSFIVRVNTLLAYSDCLDIKTSHECTQLIRYVNSKDFADIEYTTFSPTAEFYIRIPAIFFHERNQDEEESFELSSEQMVRLRNEIKVKRLLEIGFMPDYMHRKLLLILAHDTVEIDGEEWIKRDPYEKVDGNRRYSLKKANVLLTQQGYIKRNIL